MYVIKNGTKIVEGGGFLAYQTGFKVRQFVVIHASFYRRILFLIPLVIVFRKIV